MILLFIPKRTKMDLNRILSIAQFFTLQFKNSIKNMDNPLICLQSQTFQHNNRPIKITLFANRAKVTTESMNYSIAFNFTTTFKTHIDGFGNLSSITIQGQKKLCLSHNNPTVLEQWSFLLHSVMHKVGFYQDVYNYEHIAEGISASVYRAKRVRDGQKVIVKKFKKSKLLGKQLLALQNQIYLLKQFTSDYFPSFQGTYLTQNSCQLLLSYSQGVNLLEYIQKPRINSDEQNKHIIQEIAHGIKQMHKKQIVHRDIKPENIIYDERTKRIKIIDFGFATNWTSKHQIFYNCGTPGYVAPECLEKGYNSISPKIDVFSLGVLTHYLYSNGKLPYDNLGKGMLIDARKCHFVFSKNVMQNKQLLSLLKRSICKLENRLSLDDFLNHELFTKKHCLLNPESKELTNPPRHWFDEDLTSLNKRLQSRAQSKHARNRGRSVRFPTSQIQHLQKRQLPFRLQSRLITDRI